MDQTDFRDIIRKPTTSNPSSSFFACKDIWEDFSSRHFEIADSATEQSVEEIIENNPNADLSKLLRARDNAWISQVKDQMASNFRANKDRLNNKQDAAAPIQLLSKAISALSSIDVSQETFLHAILPYPQ